MRTLNKMLYLPQFCKIANFRSLPRNLQEVFYIQKFIFPKESKFFHTSSTTCRINEKLKSSVEANPKPEKRNRQVLNAQESMSVCEIADSVECNLEELLKLNPGLNKNSKLNSKEVIAIAKAFNRTCEFIKRPTLDIDKKGKKINFNEYQPPSKPENLFKRPPVVTVMGHVDHGKTTLLDALRNTSVVEKEFGGITQHIGAFSVLVKSGQKITFIDTPGHAAFTTMRARGARVTDLIILVIAADDGIMEQTIESIKIANKACVKMIVAVNKIDKPNAQNINAIKDRLLLEGIQVEDKGGDVQIVPISALKKINLDLLIEMILAEAEIMNLQGDPTGLVEGVVIESKMGNQGPQATVIVKRGTLKKGKILLAGTSSCRVRSIVDENGKECAEVTPSIPAQIFGWKTVPKAGDQVFEVSSSKAASQIIKSKKQEELLEVQKVNEKIISEKHNRHQEQHHQHKLKLKSIQNHLERKKYRMEQWELERQKMAVVDTTPSLNIIFRGDVHGSVEVFQEILETYENHEECKVSIVEASVGDITPSNVDLAETCSAIIYGFNVTLHNNVKELIKEKAIDVRLHNVIYKMIDDIKSELTSRLPPKICEKIIGEADVLENFLVSKTKKKKVSVAGCKCTMGELQKNAFFKIVRNDEVIHTGKLFSMKHFKSEVETIRKNVECGLMFESFTSDFKPTDKIICFEYEEVPSVTSWDPGF